MCGNYLLAAVLRLNILFELAETRIVGCQPVLPPILVAPATLNVWAQEQPWEHSHTEPRNDIK